MTEQYDLSRDVYRAAQSVKAMLAGDDARCEKLINSIENQGIFSGVMLSIAVALARQCDVISEDHEDGRTSAMVLDSVVVPISDSAKKDLADGRLFVETDDDPGGQYYGLYL